jgi:hypothetical protein
VGNVTRTRDPGGLMIIGLGASIAVTGAKD